jgi:hypothetical protein
MRFVLALAIVAMTIGYFGHRAASSLQNRAGSSKASISRVNELMRRAASGEPLDGRPAPDPAWVGRMTAACTRRESRLAGVPRSATTAGIASRSRRILAIYRRYAARVAAIRPPAAYRAEAREIRAFDKSHERALERIVVAATSGDLGRVTRRSVALRELAGQENAVLLRLGLSGCAFRSSGMPL